jgi:hypothetical protein
VGQRAHKTIKNRKVKLSRHDSRLFNCKSDLLLVMPTLGEFPRGVETVRGYFLSGPCGAFVPPSPEYLYAGRLIFGGPFGAVNQ